MERSSIGSECGMYRYYLTRRWGGGKSMVFILLNPGMADDQTDDAITAKCCAIAQRNNCTAIEVVCVYGYATKKLKELWRADDPVGPDNLHHIAFAVAGATGPVVCAWGASAAPDDTDHIMNYLASKGVRAKCLGVDEDGNPLHPLTLADTTKLEPFA